MTATSSRACTLVQTSSCHGSTLRLMSTHAGYPFYFFLSFPSNRIDHLFPPRCCYVPFRYDLRTIVAIHNRYVTNCIAIDKLASYHRATPCSKPVHSTLQRSASKFELRQDDNGGVDGERKRRREKHRRGSMDAGKLRYHVKQNVSYAVYVVRAWYQTRGLFTSRLEAADLYDGSP